MTDRAGALFDHHLNISPTDKSEAIDRILHAAPDFILFSDAAYDSRVFALAHERLAPYQAALWGWGGTVAIPTLDFFFAPTMLWQGRSCALQGRGSRELEGSNEHSQHIFSIHSLNTPTYLLNTSSQHTFSTNLLNTLSIHQTITLNA